MPFTGCVEVRQQLTVLCLRSVLPYGGNAELSAPPRSALYAEYCKPGKCNKRFLIVKRSVFGNSLNLSLSLSLSLSPLARRCSAAARGQQVASQRPNRDTFHCPLCREGPLDCLDLTDHVTNTHAGSKEKVVR